MPHHLSPFSYCVCNRGVCVCTHRHSQPVRPSAPSTQEKKTNKPRTKNRQSLMHVAPVRADNLFLSTAAFGATITQPNQAAWLHHHHPATTVQQLTLSAPFSPRSGDLLPSTDTTTDPPFKTTHVRVSRPRPPSRRVCRTA